MTSLTRIPWPRYQEEYAPIQAAIFSGRDADEEPFADARWPMIPLAGGLLLDRDVLAALAAATAAQGDEAFVAAYRSTVFDDPPPLRVPWTAQALEELRCGTPFGHVDADLFGASGRWGLLASCEGYAVLGGTDAFVADFVARVEGGMDRLRAGFAEAARAGTIGFGEPGARFAARLMERAGWT